jgi:hypothetical protein
MNRNVSKKIYLAFDMNTVLNPEIYDTETFQEAIDNDLDIWNSPQINNISFHLPTSPLLYQSNKISQVSLYMYILYK